MVRGDSERRVVLAATRVIQRLRGPSGFLSRFLPHRLKPKIRRRGLYPAKLERARTLSKNARRQTDMIKAGTRIGQAEDAAVPTEDRRDSCVHASAAFRPVAVPS